MSSLTQCNSPPMGKIQTANGSDYMGENQVLWTGYFPHWSVSVSFPKFLAFFHFHDYHSNDNISQCHDYIVLIIAHCYFCGKDTREDFRKVKFQQNAFLVKT